MQYAAPHMTAAYTAVTTKLATKGSGRYHTRSSPTGPAEQEEGGSLDEESISALWKPKDDVLNSVMEAPFEDAQDTPQKWGEQHHAAGDLKDNDRKSEGVVSYRPRSVSSLLILLRAMSKVCDVKRV